MMIRLPILALTAALLAAPILSGPAMAGGMIAFDLPNLTWPEGTVQPPTEGGVVLGTKSAKG